MFKFNIDLYNFYFTKYIQETCILFNENYSSIEIFHKIGIFRELFQSLMTSVYIK